MSVGGLPLTDVKARAYLDSDGAFECFPARRVAVLMLGDGHEGNLSPGRVDFLRRGSAVWLSCFKTVLAHLCCKYDFSTWFLADFGRGWGARMPLLCFEARGSPSHRVSKAAWHPGTSLPVISAWVSVGAPRDFLCTLQKRGWRGPVIPGDVFSALWAQTKWLSPARNAPAAWKRMRCAARTPARDMIEPGSRQQGRMLNLQPLQTKKFRFIYESICDLFSM